MRESFELLAALFDGKFPTALDEFSFDVPPHDGGVIVDLPGLDPTAPQPVPRWCCAIGWEPALEGLPGTTLALDRQQLLGHYYGGTGYEGVPINWGTARFLEFVGLLTDTAPEWHIDQGIPRQIVSEDPVGYIYTSRGGLVDIGHVRGLADRTRYMASQVHQHLPQGGEIPVYGEHGSRVVRLKQAIADPDPELSARIGARIAYEMSIWHEMATFFTWEQYSAFSPEDNYSNLLGCYVGYRSLFDQKNDYNLAMDVALAHVLLQLGYHPKEVTQDAVGYVNDHWYQTNPAYDVEEMPSGAFPDYSPWWQTAPLRPLVQLELLKRHFDAFDRVEPWLIHAVDVPGKPELRDKLRDVCGHPSGGVSIEVPRIGPAGDPLTDYYEFENAVDMDRIPASFYGSLGPKVTPAHFPQLVAQIRGICEAKYGSDTGSPF